MRRSIQQITRKWSVQTAIAIFLLAMAFTIPPREAEATVFQTGCSAGVQVKWYGFALTAGNVLFVVRAYNVVTGATVTDVETGVLTLGSTIISSRRIPTGRLFLLSHFHQLLYCLKQQRATSGSLAPQVLINKVL